MKKTLTLLTVLFATITFAQPKVYINLNSHNEVSGEPAYDQAPGINYATIYPFVKTMSDSVISKKVKWNFQSDVRFLLGCIKYDVKSVSTGNKNILRWMDESVYIECDPHSHEGNVNGSVYNYADVAHLHDSLGLSTRRNVGGFKIDGLQNGSDWENFENGMVCSKFKSAPNWKPYTLWGGSYNAGVHNDVNMYGCYKPQSRANYQVHVNTNRVAEQGNGCSAHFTDTTDENRIINQLKTLFNNVHNGVYPADGFYTQAIQFDCRDIGEPNFINRLCVILDTVNNYVKKGWVEWMTITEKDEYWRSTLDSAYKYNTCDDLTSGVSLALANAKSISVFPNPGKAGLFTIDGDIELANCKIEVMDCQGKVSTLPWVNNAKNHSVDLSAYSPGLYFIRISEGGQKTYLQKLVITQ